MVRKGLGWVHIQKAAYGFSDDSTDPIQKVIAGFKKRLSQADI